MGRRPINGLSKRNKDVLYAIVTLNHDLGYPPTQGQIGEKAGISQTRVREHLEKLRELDYIELEYGKARTIHVKRLP